MCFPCSRQSLVIFGRHGYIFLRPRLLFFSCEPSYGTQASVGYIYPPCPARAATHLHRKPEASFHSRSTWRREFPDCIFSVFFRILVRFLMMDGNQEARLVTCSAPVNIAVVKYCKDQYLVECCLWLGAGCRGVTTWGGRGHLIIYNLALFPPRGQERRGPHPPSEFLPQCNIGPDTGACPNPSLVPRPIARGGGRVWERD